MSDLNRVLLAGRLGRDPELRTIASGADIAHLSVATTERWTDRASGEKRERTEWHRVVVFREGAVRFAREHLRKGDLVFVEGSLRTRKWTDQEGRERFTTEIVASNVQLLARADGSAGNGRADRENGREGTSDSASARATGSAAGGVPSASAGGGGGALHDLDDEIPFAPVSW